MQLFTDYMSLLKQDFWSKKRPVDCKDQSLAAGLKRVSEDF